MAASRSASSAWQPASTGVTDFRAIRSFARDCVALMSGEDVNVVVRAETQVQLVVESEYRAFDDGRVVSNLSIVFDEMMLVGCCN